MRGHRWDFMRRALLLVPLAVAAMATAASAQTIIPPQVNAFLCTNYDAIKNITPLVALLVFAATLIMGMVQKHASLVKDLVIGGLIGIIILSLPTILSAMGLNASCS